jgi:hypothetical protein
VILASYSWEEAETEPVELFVRPNLSTQWLYLGQYKWEKVERLGPAEWENLGDKTRSHERGPSFRVAC